MKQILNQIVLVFVLAFTHSSIALAGQGYGERDISWFSSSTSSLLNRSSIALATKHTNRGIGFAQKALEETLNPMDQLIANHNLCIGYLASDNAGLATPYCARAFEVAQDPYQVVKIRGALQIKSVDVVIFAEEKISPVEVIVRNIQQQYPKIRLALLIR